MAFRLPLLPYATSALEPHISQRTMEFHHGKHHDTYIKNLNLLIDGKPYEKMRLEEIIRRSAGNPKERAVFNNAAQAWNHEFFWNCMQPGGGGEPKREIEDRMRESFGSYADFRTAFIETAVGHFGSGWAWLALDGGKLAVFSLADAGNPMSLDRTPLLTCDVWEHAYYLDYQNRRKAFIEAFLDHLVNWEFVASRLAEAKDEQAPRRSAGSRS